MMNKFFNRAVVLSMTAITLFAGTPATTAKAADVAPVHTVVQTSGSGDSLKITYKVNLDKTEVTDGRIAVEYDPNVLEIKSDSEGIKFSDVDVNKSYSDGSSKGVAYAFVGDAAKSVSGTLMTVQFTAKKGLKKQDTVIGTKVFGINNGEKAVVENTVISDKVSVGLPKLTKPAISGISQTLLGVYVKWNEEPDADGYIVFRSTTKDGKYTEIGSVAGFNGFWDVTVSNNKTYYYKICTYRGKGQDRVYSEMSDPVSIKVKKFLGLFS